MNEATACIVFYQANLFIRAVALGLIPKCLPNTGMDSPSVTAGFTKEKAVPCLESEHDPTGMQPLDPCRPWRGTLASGHKPR